MKTLIATLVVVFLANKSTAQVTEPVVGKIITENKEGTLKIKAAAISSSETYLSLNYIMVSVKKGKSGNSTNKQSGKFSLSPKETKTLAETAINLAKNDALKVYLFVKDEESDAVISKDSLEINAANFTSEVSYIPENRIELSGLTIDNTKTRFGQQFYESFFKKYNQLPQKYEGTVTVTELPSFARNSRITVSLDDQVIYSFTTPPEEEGMDAEAGRTMAFLAEYSKRNSIRDQQFKY